MTLPDLAITYLIAFGATLLIAGLAAIGDHLSSYAREMARHRRTQL